MKRVCVFISIFIFGSCGGGSGSTDNPVTICPRVINGTSCSVGDSPIVKLNILSVRGVNSLCSGTVVAADKILTAGHCFLITNVANVTVESNSNAFAVSKVFIHPELAQNGNALFNDVAIVQTETAMNIPALPILISQSVKVGQRIGINGYGLDENNELGELKGGTMTVSETTPNHIGAKFDGSGSNTCNGDSGGPATFTIGNSAAVAGLTSSGVVTDCSAGDVTMFTNIQSASVLDFITSIVPDIGTL